jgi:ribosomal protein L31E
MDKKEEPSLQTQYNVSQEVIIIVYFPRLYRLSQKWRTNGALRCRRDYCKRQKNVKNILLDLFADLAVFESGT